MSHHTVEDGELHRQVRKGGRERERKCVFHHTVEDGELHRQVRKEGGRERDRERGVCLIIPWRMGNYTDR